MIYKNRGNTSNLFNRKLAVGDYKFEGLIS